MSTSKGLLVGASVGGWGTRRGGDEGRGSRDLDLVVPFLFLSHGFCSAERM